MSSSYKESVLLGYCNIHDWDRCLFRNYCFPVNILFPRPFRRTIINNINSRFYVGCKISLIKIRFSQIIFNAFSNWSLIHFLFLSYFFFNFLYVIYGIWKNMRISRLCGEKYRAGWIWEIVLPLNFPFLIFGVHHWFVLRIRLRSLALSYMKRVRRSILELCITSILYFHFNLFYFLFERLS